eukprot:scaffold100765_cov23-Tisochrysis_lutea.AAC.1
MGREVMGPLPSDIQLFASELTASTGHFWLMPSCMPSCMPSLCAFDLHAPLLGLPVQLMTGADDSVGHPAAFALICECLAL